MYDRQTIIPVSVRPKSLNWAAGELVDVLGGGHVWTLDGQHRPAPRRFNYRFDAAVTSPCGTYSVVYERLGTKGLVLKDLQIIREIDRSYYCADAYEFPVRIFEHNKATYLAHCPNAYNALEIENIETGERLESSEARDFADRFISRLNVSPGGKFLSMSGWVWHPVDVCEIWETSKLFEDMRTSETGYEPLDLEEHGEASSSCFISDKHLVVATHDGDERSAGLVVFDCAKQTEVSNVSLSENAGVILPVNEDIVLSLMNHPKLVQVSTGEIIKRWDHIDSGEQGSSIIHHIETMPIYAFDEQNRDFAILKGDEIIILHLG